MAAAAVGKVKKTKRTKRRRRARVGGFDLGAFDVKDLALTGAGLVGTIMVVDPLVNAIFKDKEMPSWAKLAAKAGITLGLSQVKMPEAKPLLRGAALATILEGAKIAVPGVFQKLSARMSGTDTDAYYEHLDNVEITLEDINGYGDDDFSVAGYDDDDYDSVADNVGDEVAVM